MSNLEIERRFLFKDNGSLALADLPYVEIEQGYLVNTQALCIRVRKCGVGGAYMAIKKRINDMTREEYEWKIDIKAAESLLAGCDKTIAKKRYAFDDGKHWYDIDVFLGKNEGLIMVEVELKTPEDELIPKDWIGQEVTRDPRFINANLVNHPFSKFRDEFSPKWTCWEGSHGDICVKETNKHLIFKIGAPYTIIGLIPDMKELTLTAKRIDYLDSYFPKVSYKFETAEDVEYVQKAVEKAIYTSIPKVEFTFGEHANTIMIKRPQMQKKDLIRFRCEDIVGVQYKRRMGVYKTVIESCMAETQEIEFSNEFDARHVVSQLRWMLFGMTEM